MEEHGIRWPFVRASVFRVLALLVWIVCGYSSACELEQLKADVQDSASFFPTMGADLSASAHPKMAKRLLRQHERLKAIQAAHQAANGETKSLLAERYFKQELKIRDTLDQLFEALEGSGFD